MRRGQVAFQLGNDGLREVRCCTDNNALPFEVQHNGVVLVRRSNLGPVRSSIFSRDVREGHLAKQEGAGLDRMYRNEAKAAASEHFP